MNGKVKVQGMTLVEVVVAIALFAIFLSFVMGLFQIGMTYEGKIWRDIEDENNADVIVDFVREEIGLAEEVCLYVERIEDGGIRRSIDICHPGHNTGVVDWSQVVSPRKLDYIIVTNKSNEESNKRQIMSFDKGEMTFQGQRVGDRLRQVMIGWDDAVELVTFTFEIDSLKSGGKSQTRQLVVDLSYKR